MIRINRIKISKDNQPGLNFFTKNVWTWIFIFDFYAILKILSDRISYGDISHHFLHWEEGSRINWGIHERRWLFLR